MSQCEWVYLKPFWSSGERKEEQKTACTYSCSNWVGYGQVLWAQNKGEQKWENEVIDNELHKFDPVPNLAASELLWGRNALCKQESGYQGKS